MQQDELIQSMNRQTSSQSQTTDIGNNEVELLRKRLKEYEDLLSVKNNELEELKGNKNFWEKMANGFKGENIKLKNANTSLQNENKELKNQVAFLTTDQTSENTSVSADSTHHEGLVVAGDLDETSV